MNLPKRKNNRLKDYDYSQPGAYFVTICTKDRKEILSHIKRDKGIFDYPQIILTKAGEIAQNEILEIEKHYENIKIDKYVIMPNHIHIIVRITERINPFPTKKYDIPNIIGKFKASVTRNVGKAFMPSEKLWQASFYDHIIRTQQDYKEIWEYIENNPLKWREDCFYSK